MNQLNHRDTETQGNTVYEPLTPREIWLSQQIVNIALKAQDHPQPVWDAQLISYLKLTKKRLGYIINFHVPLIKNGIKE